MQKPLSPLQAPALSSARHGTTSSTTRRGALLGLSALALALGGCGGSGGSAPQPGERAAITLLVYIIGSDLESDHDAASGNIEEMQSVTPNARVNVVLSTGGADKDGWRTVQRKRINGAQIELLADLGPVNMGRQETLQDFITWGLQSYPAERTLLVLWNHGGGPNVGVGPDELFYKTGGTLSLGSIRAAIAAATQTAGRKLDMVGFDTCVMGCVEVAQALAPYADYLVASEDLEPGTGQDWAALLQHLTTRPADSTESFGRTIVDAFVAKTLAIDLTDDATLSLTDLRKIDAVTTALASVSATLSRALAADPVQTWLAIAQARATAALFHTPPLAMHGAELADMALFSWGSLPLPESERKQLLAALEQAVVHEKHSPSLPALAGLTLYLPQRVLGAGQDLQTYAALSFLPTAQRELMAHCHRVGADTTLLPRPAIGPIDWSHGAAQAPGRIEAALQTVARGLVAQDFAVLQETGTGQMRALKPLASGTADRLVDTDFMDGWLQLPDASGNAVYFTALPDGQRFDTEAPETFLVPVLLRDLDQRRTGRAYLIVTDIAERGVLRATGWIDFDGNTSTASAAPRAMALPANAEAQPLWMYVDEEHAPGWNTASIKTPYARLQPGQAFTRGRLSALPAGTAARLAALDVRGWVSLDAPAG
jgi:hypothetical protein